MTSTTTERYIEAALSECEGFTQQELDRGVISCLVAEYPVLAEWLQNCRRALGTEMFLECCPISEAERAARLPQIARIEAALAKRPSPFIPRTLALCP